MTGFEPDGEAASRGDSGPSSGGDAVENAEGEQIDTIDDLVAKWEQLPEHARRGILRKAQQALEPKIHQSTLALAGADHDPVQDAILFREQVAEALGCGNRLVTEYVKQGFLDEPAGRSEQNRAYWTCRQVEAAKQRMAENPPKRQPRGGRSTRQPIEDQGKS